MGRFATSFVWLGAIVAIGLAIGYFFWPQFMKLEKLNQTDRRLQLRIEAEDRKNRYLQKEEHQLRTNPDYVEKVAREKLGLIKQGEVIYKFEKDKEF